MENSMKDKILIIDDEKSNILYLNNILGEDYEIFTARNGPDAISLAEEFLPDLILLDIIMPGMDGYDVFEALKESDVTRDIPVIFITGLSGIDSEAKGLSLGASDYITKPFNDDVVRLRVKNQMKIVAQMKTINKS